MKKNINSLINPKDFHVCLARNNKQWTKRTISVQKRGSNDGFHSEGVPLLFMETTVRFQAERRVPLLVIQRTEIYLQSPASCNKAQKQQAFVQVRAHAAFQRARGLFSSHSAA